MSAQGYQAVVLGKEFRFNLSAVAGSGEEGVTESLDRLVHDGLVREKGREVYEFVSEAVRRDLHGLATQQHILHAQDRRALEGHAAGRAIQDYARHFYLGREDAKAVEYNMKAAGAEARDFAFQARSTRPPAPSEADDRRSVATRGWSLPADRDWPTLGGE